MRPWECPQMDTQTHWQTQTAICCSNGTDKKARAPVYTECFNSNNNIWMQSFVDEILRSQDGRCVIMWSDVIIIIIIIIINVIIQLELERPWIFLQITTYKYSLIQESTQLQNTSQGITFFCGTLRRAAVFVVLSRKWAKSQNLGFPRKFSISGNTSKQMF